MGTKPSRRDFIAAGLSMPVAGFATTHLPQSAPKHEGKALQGPAKTELEFRTLGKTGQKVTSVGFGCMITSDPSVIARAVDMGITYFDTARGYQNGNNERMVGAALKGNRDKLILSSKSTAKTAKEAFDHLDTSLKELGTDHLDIWYMHARDEVSSVTDELVEAWENAKKQGKIRFIGLSTHNPNAMAERILQAGKFEVVLVTYNFAVGSDNDVSLKRIHDAGIGLVAMKVMAPASRAYGFKATSSDRMKNPDAPLAALKWVLRNKNFATTIPSMTDSDQLEANFKAMSEKFTTSDERLLAAVDEQIRPLYCRMCYSCSGQCPKGVPVPEMIRYLSYADFYGQFQVGREHFVALPQDSRDVRCRDCSSCSVHCPNGVHVSERLIRAQELFG
jgi:uncharacterized protein